MSNTVTRIFYENLFWVQFLGYWSSLSRFVEGNQDLPQYSSFIHYQQNTSKAFKVVTQLCDSGCREVAAEVAMILFHMLKHTSNPHRVPFLPLWFWQDCVHEKRCMELCLDNKV